MPANEAGVLPPPLGHGRCRTPPQAPKYRGAEAEVLRCTVQLQGALLIKAPEFAPPSNTSRHPRGTSLRCLPVRTRRGEVSSLCFPYNKG